MGHMNVRHYLAHAGSGLAGLAFVCGMPDAFARGANSTILPREHHVRFLREARAGAPLHIEGGVLSVGEAEAEILLIMRHSLSGEPCASFVIALEHVTGAGRSFPWSSRARSALEAHRCERPAFAGPRGVPGGGVKTTAALRRADALKMPSAGLGIVRPDECDLHGRLRPDSVMARFSDGAAQLFGAPGEPHTRRGGPRVGGALLEIRILQHRAAGVGQLLTLRSTLTATDPRLNHLTHWLLDAASGEPVATARGVAAALDLDARRLVERTPDQLAALGDRLIPQAGW